MMQEFVVDIPRDEWWTQNRRGHWRVKFAHTSAVKQRAVAFARFWLQNGHHRPQHFPVHVTAIIHPLTHGRFDPENAAPMVKAILDALTDVGGLELSSRFASVKKGDLAMSAERVFAGTYITEVEVRERALAWVPEVMRFADQPEIPADNEAQSPDADFVANDDNQPPSELAA